VIGFLLGYYSEFYLLKNTISLDYEKIAYVLASNVRQRIEEEVSYLQGSIAYSNLYKNALKERNTRYEKMNKMLLVQKMLLRFKTQEQVMVYL